MILFVGLVIPLTLYVAHKRRKDVGRIKKRSTRLVLKRTESELKNTSFINEELQGQLRQKQEKLEVFVKQLLKRNEEISGLEAELSNAVKVQDESLIQRQEQLLSHLYQRLSSEKDWIQFIAFFEELYPGYLQSLKAKFPALTSHELRICCLLKINLTSKEIGSFLNITPASVNTARYRLRKKLGISNVGDLINI